MGLPVHLSAARWAKSRANCLNRWQLLSLGNRVSSANDRETISGGGKLVVRALWGYMPQNVCCSDSMARGIGVVRRYMWSVFEMISGMNPSWST